MTGALKNEKIPPMVFKNRGRDFLTEKRITGAEF